MLILQLIFGLINLLIAGGLLFAAHDNDFAIEVAADMNGFDPLPLLSLFFATNGLLLWWGRA